MQGLSENDIKQTTLRFLKAYYRYRQREGGTTVSSDMRGAGGIIADGFLSYPKPGGEIFHATFEATSQDTRDEVRFKIQKRRLQWDAIAVASLAAAVLFIAGNVEQLFNFKKITLFTFWWEIWLHLLIESIKIEI